MVFSFYNIKINKIIFLDININIKFYNYKFHKKNTKKDRN